MKRNIFPHKVVLCSTLLFGGLCQNKNRLSLNTCREDFQRIGKVLKEFQIVLLSSKIAKKLLKICNFAFLAFNMTLKFRFDLIRPA